MYYHKARGLRLSVHGDDVMCAGPLNQLRWMMSVLDKHFESKHKIMGEAKHLLKEVKILNRDAKWSKKGISLEADAKHVKTLLKEMKMEDAKAVKTPAETEPVTKMMKPRSMSLRSRIRNGLTARYWPVKRPDLGAGRRD
jgi:hypothetical protein